MGSERKAHLPSPHGAQEGIQHVNFNNKQQVKMGFPRNEKDEAGAGGLKGPHFLQDLETGKQWTLLRRVGTRLHVSPSVWGPKTQDAAACGAEWHPVFPEGPGRVFGPGLAGEQAKGQWGQMRKLSSRPSM